MDNARYWMHTPVCLRLISKPPKGNLSLPAGVIEVMMLNAHPIVVTDTIHGNQYVHTAWDAHPKPKINSLGLSAIRTYSVI